MRIAFVEPHLELYGGIRRILHFANRFVDRGHDVTVFHPAGTPCAWMPCRARVEPLAALSGRRHDVLVFNDPPHWRLARRARAAVKIHYILALYDRERLARFDPRVWWPRRGRTMSLKRALREPFVHVANATWMQHWLRERMGLDVELQLGGVDTDTFHPVDVPRADRPIVLASGDPRPRKGMNTVFEAIARVRQRRPDVELRTYHGRGIPQREMASVYAGADVFVDGQHYAGWNNPVVEAMACGTPVVCTDIGGVADFAEPDRTALLVPVGDADAMARAILRLLEDRALAERLRRAALERVRRFDWEAAADAFLALMRRHLEGGRGRRTG